MPKARAAAPAPEAARPLIDRVPEQFLQPAARRERAHLHRIAPGQDHPSPEATRGRDGIQWQAPAFAAADGPDRFARIEDARRLLPQVDASRPCETTSRSTTSASSATMLWPRRASSARSELFPDSLSPMTPPDAAVEHKGAGVEMHRVRASTPRLRQRGRDKGERARRRRALCRRVDRAQRHTLDGEPIACEERDRRPVGGDEATTERSCAGVPLDLESGQSGSPSTS